MTDFTIIDHGSIVVLNANTQEAQEWIDEYIDPDAQRWGQNGVVIEPRYISNIIQGIDEAELTIS